MVVANSEGLCLQILRLFQGLRSFYQICISSLFLIPVIHRRYPNDPLKQS